MAGDRDDRLGKDPIDDNERESLTEVLASIRALVSAETEARVTGAGEGGGTVLMLTREMRAGSDRDRAGALLAEGIGSRSGKATAPILDEESLRDLINAIAREELEGELGERISRNLRRLVRQEMAQFLEEHRKRE